MNLSVTLHKAEKACQRRTVYLLSPLINYEENKSFATQEWEQGIGSNYQIAKEDFLLMSWQGPGFVNFEVDFGWRDDPEDLLASEDVVPYWRTTEVDVKI